MKRFSLHTAMRTALGVTALTAALGATVIAHAAPATRLVLAIKGEPEQGFDPIKGWGEYGNPLFQSTLLKYDAKLNLVGDLATKWSLSADRLTWTINIREGVKFSDGKLLTAEDVAFTFEAGKKAASALDLTMMDSARAINPATVEIKLKQPRITFVQTLVSLGIVPKHTYAEGYGDKPVGSGPFKFLSWNKGQQLIVEPNPHYYGKKPQFERVTFLFTAEDASLAAAKSRQAHIAYVPATLAGSVPAHMQRLAVPTVDSRGLMFPTVPNTGKKTADGAAIGNDTTADPAIRQAINVAVNRKLLASGALGGFASAAYGPADGLPWDNAQQRLPDNNLAEAKAILKKAGWVESGGKISKNGKPAQFTIIYPSSDGTRQALALAAADMIRPLGIEVNLSGKTWSDIKRDMHSNVMLFGGGSHSPRDMYNWYHAANAGKEWHNPGFYSNATVSAHMDAAEKAPSFQASLALWKKAMWDGKTGFGMKGDAAWAWLVGLQRVYFVDKCLDIGPRQIEQHGHGFPVAWNIQDWKWTCK